MELIKTIGQILLVNVILYLIGSFIALDLDPQHWWLFRSLLGRIVVIPLEVMIIAMALQD